MYYYFVMYLRLSRTYDEHIINCTLRLLYIAIFSTGRMSVKNSYYARFDDCYYHAKYYGEVQRGGLCFIKHQRYIPTNKNIYKTYYPTVESNCRLYEPHNKLTSEAHVKHMKYKNTPDNACRSDIVEVGLHFPMNKAT